MSDERVTRRPVWPLLVAPIVLTSGIGLLALSNALIYVGPLDRAQFGWLVPIPMVLLSPAIAGLAARRSGERWASIAIALIAVGLGAVTTALLVAMVDHIGCEPVADKGRVLLHVLPIGIAASGGFAVAGFVALWLRSRPVGAVAAAVVAAIAAGIVTLLVFAASFPGVTCAPGSA